MPTLDFLDFFGRIESEDIKKYELDILKHLQSISSDFSSLKGDALTENEYIQLCKYYEQWKSFLIKNFYSINKSTTLFALQEEEERFFATDFDPNTKEIYEDDELIRDGNFDSMAVHFWIEFVKFFRLSLEYQTKSQITQSPPPIETLILQVIELFPPRGVTDVEGVKKKIEQLVGLFSTKLKDTDSDDEDEMNIEDTNEVSFDDIHNPHKQDIRVDPKAPTRHEILSSLSIFVHSTLVLEKKYLGLGESTLLSDGEFAFDSILSKWIVMNERFIDDRNFEVIERLLFVLCCFPGLKDAFINSYIFHKEEEEMKNKCYLFFAVSRRYKNAMKMGQPGAFEFLDKYNKLQFEMADYYYHTDFNYTSESFKLIIFHYIVMQEMKYQYWFFRFVVPLEAFCKYRKQVLDYSEKTPLFLKVEPHRYEMIHKKKLFHGTVSALLCYWMEANKNIGIVAFEDPSECRWLYTWNKYYRNTIDMAKCLHRSNITNNMITKDYVPNEISGELKTSDAPTAKDPTEDELVEKFKESLKTKYKDDESKQRLFSLF